MATQQRHTRPGGVGQAHNCLDAARQTLQQMCKNVGVYATSCMHHAGYFRLGHAACCDACPLSAAAHPWYKSDCLAMINVHCCSGSCVLSTCIHALSARRSSPKRYIRTLLCLRIDVALTGPTPLCSEVYDTKGASLCITDRAKRSVSSTGGLQKNKQYCCVPQLLACLLYGIFAAPGLAERGGTGRDAGEAFSTRCSTWEHSWTPTCQLLHYCLIICCCCYLVHT